MLAGGRGSILAVAFAADDKTLAAGDARGRVRLWNPATGDERGNFVADSLGLHASPSRPTAGCWPPRERVKKA